MSTIEITDLYWSNTFSYGPDNHIKLNEHKISQIIGHNGIGKSSIPLTLEEGTYNKNSKGIKKTDIKNRNLSDAYKIKTLFRVKNDKYELEVIKGSTLKASLTKNGEDISAHTGSKTIAIVEELFGMSFKTFTQLIYQNTESSLEFLTATDSKRKEFLINLFDLTEYVNKQSNYSKAIKDINTRVSTLKGKVESSKTNINRFSTLVSEEPLPEVDVLEVPETLYSEKATIENNIGSIEEKNNRIKESNSVLTKLASTREPEEIQSEIDKIELEDTSKLTEQLGRLNSEIKQAKTVVTKVEGLDGQCPTCLQEVDKEFTSTLLESNRSIIDSSRVEAQKILDRVREIEALEKRQRALISELNSRKALENKKLEEEYQEFLDVENLESDLADITKSIADYKKKISAALENNRKATTHNAKIENSIENLELERQNLSTYESELNTLEKKLIPLELIKKALGPQGLVAYKLENMVHDLEVHTNTYLSKLSDGRFNLAFELNNDKLNVIIYDDGMEIPITPLSSGQRARVVIGTLLGIRKLMQEISKSSINILFLDEVISVMDDIGKEQLVEVLLEEEGLNSFLVSHSWEHPLVNKILIKQDEGGLSYVS